MHLPPNCFDQVSYRCRLDWGWDGARRAAARGDVLVVVDVLRFSTATAVAVQQGAYVVPSSPVAGHRPLESAAAGERLTLASPNGALCAIHGREAPYLFAGSLVNASTVSAAVELAANRLNLAVTVIACGERRREASEDGALRFALEDYLGAGAILSRLPFDKSPEAFACEHAFRGCRDRLQWLLRDCGSGRELLLKGRAVDVDFAAQLDRCDTAPIMWEGCLRRFHGGMLG